MSRPRNPVPTYRLHRQSGQAVVTLADGLGGRRDVLLGAFDTPESREEYRRVLAEWEANGRRPPAGGSDLTVCEVMLAYWRHAEAYYRSVDGRPTSEQDCIRAALKPLRELYGAARAADFGPLALKAVQGRMVATGWCRNLVNKQVGRIKRMLKWAVSEELLPPSVYHGVQSVAGLKRGRSPARETPPVRPVPDAFVDAVLPHVLPPVRAMIELQRLTGARPGEVCQMRASDIDTSGRVWLYRPPHHKTAWRGRERVIALGPRAQEIVKEFLTTDLTGPLFSPARALAERAAVMRAARKSKVQPSQQNRRRKNPKRPPRDCYTALTYQGAIHRGCRKADVPIWGPNRLRHNFATEVRRRYGLEAAGAALGHQELATTQIYAAADAALSERVAREIG